MNPPYCILNELNILNHGLQAITPEELRRLRMKIALCVSQPEAVERLLGPEGEIFDDFYPDTAMPDPDTNSTINDFLDRFGHGDEKETDLLTRMIFTPSPSSAEGWLQTEDSTQIASTPSDPTSRGIESFLESRGEEEVRPTKKTGASLTESLAQIMIKKGNYGKALEIITQLSLSEPEKSIYFADQIRFLKKLIKNQKKLNNN